MPDTELVFLPLGGCEEIGMNLNAYGYGPPHARKWILVDLGVTFGDLTTPGVDIICADPSFLEDEDIEAIFLTHAHEDHIGASGLLWPRFKAPMYATPFTAALVADKLNDHNLSDDMLHVLPQGATVEAGPFSVRYVTLTHSIPEPNALAITTPEGVILHTGDWKIDPDPLIGPTTDVEALSAYGDAGVLAMVCDSTNVFEEGEAGSEATVRQALIDLVGSIPTGRIALATFASNVARVESAIRAAEANGRHVCLSGRSMHRIAAAAKSVGLLKDVQDFVDEEEAGYLPPEKVLYLCTGSQGEPRAALGKIARGEHRHITMGAGDTVIYSSRVIPGNEREIFAMQNLLADKGVSIITPRMIKDPIHVSGHPCRDELRRMYQWVRPRIAVPVHGERRHTLEHATYAKSLQVSEAVSPKNGQMVRLAPGPAEIVDGVPAGRLFLDGDKLVPENSGGILERRKLSHSGIVHVSVAIDEVGRVVDGPLATARGFSEADGRPADESLDALDEAGEHAVSLMKAKALANDEDVERVVGRAVRKAAERAFGRRPVVDVTVLRV